MRLSIVAKKIKEYNNNNNNNLGKEKLEENMYGKYL